MQREAEQDMKYRRLLTCEQEETNLTIPEHAREDDPFVYSSQAAESRLCHFPRALEIEELAHM